MKTGGGDTYSMKYEEWKETLNPNIEILISYKMIKYASIELQLHIWNLPYSGDAFDLLADFFN